METQPFLNNLWSADLVLEKFGTTTRVYPADPIIDTFKLCELREQLLLLDKHRNEIAGSEEQIKRLIKYFDADIARIEENYGYRSDGEFDAMDFLESVSVAILKFKEEHDESYLCWPVDDRDSLKACFKEYHVYKFYEKYMYEIPMGVEKFLNVIPEMEFAIQQAKINDDFYWNREDTSFLHEYREAKRVLMTRSSLPPIEA